MFIQELFSEDGRQFYLFWVTSIVVSIVLHELAHGWAAIHYGDDTPIRQERMTGNPLIHMGPYSLAALFLMGIAWGQMPVDPTRLRGRYAEAKVAAAGPAMNLMLAIIVLTALGLWIRLGDPGGSQVRENLVHFLSLFGATNLLLCMFNLIPVPPLDGSHIMANFHRGYALATDDPAKQGVWTVAFMAVFFLAGAILVGWAHAASLWYTGLVAGVYL